ncbi:polysaccharide deacetylase family protein [Methylomonas sp. OY6]|uniref:Polysaccharide deacetylase family protein n=1 Tax=Methylomonas defluvii TaxID=3045149 RepID=A0ABU4UJU8_9GAMM|nr:MULTISPECIES: polysaccharide deacetylase family protein [unclassified Methylomonas]MDX8129787.1 polysaccharide deacetylase family protein [Methylomonas sp. OY6]
MMNFSAYRNWQPTPLMKVSLAITIAAPLAIVIQPSIWPWALMTFIADQLVLTFAGLWPRCSWVGSNWTSLPPAAAARGDIAITIDDGPDPEITPAVLDLLDRFGAKATFFCIADKAQRYPDLCRDIVKRGHAVENHSMHHQYHLPFLLLNGWMAELNAAQDTLTEVTGIRPRFFRPPVGLRNPLLDPVLSRLGLQLASWTKRGFDTIEGNPQVVLAKLLKDLKAGDILLLHDSNVARTSNNQPVILEVLPPLLEAIAVANLQPVTLSESLDRCQNP